MSNKSLIQEGNLKTYEEVHPMSDSDISYGAEVSPDYQADVDASDISLSEGISTEFNGQAQALSDEHGHSTDLDKAYHEEMIKNYSQRAASGEDIEIGFRLSGSAAQSGGGHGGGKKRKEKKHREMMRFIQHLQQIQQQIQNAKARIERLDQEIQDLRDLVLFRKQEIEQREEIYRKREQICNEGKNIADDRWNEEYFAEAEARKYLNENNIYLPDKATSDEVHARMKRFITKQEEWLEKECRELDLLQEDTDLKTNELAEKEVQKAREQENLKRLEKEAAEIEADLTSTKQQKEDALLAKTKNHSNRTVEMFSENSRDLALNDRFDQAVDRQNLENTKVPGFSF